MARQYLPRANLIQGGTVPVSAPGVSLPMQNPALQQEAAFYTTLSERLDQFSTLAFKKAGEKAEAAGLQFGAKNAPTLEQVELAQKTGQPVEVDVGDPGGNIFEKAAYKGSMAVVEDNFEIAARRALTEVFAKATQDPNMTPSELTEELDRTVNEYSLAMKNISGSSGAKVRAALGIVANSQVVQFSREYMRKQAKELSSKALLNAKDVTADSIGEIFGHIESDKTGVLLKDKLEKAEKRIRDTMAQGGHKEDAIQRVIREHRKQISQAKSDAIRAWTIDGRFAGNPTKAIIQMRFLEKNKPNAVPGYIKDIWATMGPQQKLKAMDDLRQEVSSQNQTRRINEGIETEQNNRIKAQANSDFTSALSSDDRVKMQKAIDLMMTVDPVEARKLEKILDTDAGVITDNQGDLQKLDTLLSANALTLSDIDASNLTRKTKGQYITKIVVQRDRLVAQATEFARGTFQPDFDDPNPSDTQKEENNKFKRVKLKLLEKRLEYDASVRDAIKNSTTPPSKPFDAMKVVKDEIEEVEKEVLKSKKRKTMKRLNSFYRRNNVPSNFTQDKDGLRKYIESLPSGSFKRQPAQNILDKLIDLDAQ